MPAPQKTQLAQLTKVNFNAKQIALPVKWKPPGDQYPDAFEPSERVTVPNPPNTLFVQATLNKYHVDDAKDIGKNFEDYIDGISDGICDGVDKWLKMATIVGVIITGPVGMVTPGMVQGPPLGPLILAKAPMKTPQEQKYSNAIANALGTVWQAWHLAIVGTLQYPAFAAFPGPVAPPTPNVPIPLAALPSPGEVGLAPPALQGLMFANLADPEALHALDLFNAMATAFNTVFQTFKATTMVQNVLGTGPIPTFAPPFVPVGPVVGGVGNGAPGCLQ